MLYQPSLDEKEAYVPEQQNDQERSEVVSWDCRWMSVREH